MQPDNDEFVAEDNQKWGMKLENPTLQEYKRWVLNNLPDCVDDPEQYDYVICRCYVKDLSARGCVLFLS